MKKLSNYIFKYKILTYSGVILSFLVVILMLAPAKLLQILTQRVQEGYSFRQLLKYILLGIILYSFQAIVRFLKNFVMEYLGKRVITDIRNDIFSKLVYFPLKFFRNKKVGDIISRILNDTSILEIFVQNQLSSIIISPLMVIGGLVFLFYFNTKFSLFLLSISPLIILFIHLTGKFVKKITQLTQDKLAFLTELLEQVLTNIQVIKIFSTEQKEIKRFKKRNYIYLKNDRLRIIATSLVKPVTEYIGALAIIGIITFGIHLFIAKELTMDAIVGYITVLFTISPHISVFSNIFVQIQRVKGATASIFEILNEEEEEMYFNRATNTEKIELKNIKGKIEFKNISFGYSKKNMILKNINFTINPGEVIALVGSSGGGKTTMASLIPGFFIPNAGQVLIDGIDIQNIKLKSLRKHIGIVPQDSLLFTDTILENIKYGNPGVSFEEVKEATRIAGLDKFISELKYGYNTEIGDKGAKLSGGQKQRISIARAILRRPGILILDEATSALDSETESQIQDSLLDVMRKQTTIIIAHRLSTIKNADRIVVIEDGEIIEVGTHEELIEQNNKYKKLYNLQFEK